ncbi:hypothetical protein [Methanobrevibacter sp. UBA417]|uniref:hypothetical protein n=1 Tax=Methanobrevibacter sp. UBA417 TaxID=1915487 RepID=UPI0039B8E2F6
MNVSNDFYGETPSPKAIEIADYEFFWDCVDQLAPFGSDEGYMAFVELCDWREDNPNAPLIECFNWILNSWDLNLEDYNEEILEDSNITKIIKDKSFDEDLIMLDVTIIATAFGQLILEGKIDADVKNIVQLAVLRQMNHLVLDEFLGYNEEWKYDRYKYLQILLDILKIA